MMCSQTSSGKETWKVMILHHLAINLHKWLLLPDLGMRLLVCFDSYQYGKVYSEVCNKHPGIPDKTLPADFQEKILTQLRGSDIQVDIYNVRFEQLKEEVTATLIACGHCYLSDLLPYLEVGNKDQIDMLQIMLQWVYPSGESCCNKDPIGSVSSHKITDSQNTPIKSPNISCDSTVLDTGMPKKVIETEATTELPTCHLTLNLLKLKRQKMT